ncbi:MAG: type IVB secretion system apparatus protein IcmL/DotI [Alphaproteobacteria bacterium]|nr:type IVB secretion system apparatus protein IcmL/DotI [Alphaproteobacteria bacterium]
MPAKDAVATVLNRNAFYRDGYRLLLKISLVQAAVIALLIASIVGMVLTMKPRPVYFATTSDGRIINIVPLDQPYVSNAQLIAWAAGTAQNVMRFDYDDYRARLQQVSSGFTTTGWDSFNKALKDANFIDAIEARKLVVSMSINAAPEIQSAFVHNGVYTWYVQFPVTITFDGDQPPQPINAILHLQIVRVSTLQNPDGISIEQWVQTIPGNKQ